MSELVLAEAREQIDAVDRGLLAGINRRIELVRALHDHKVATGLPLRDPGREQSMVTALQRRPDSLFAIAVNTWVPMRFSGLRIATGTSMLVSNTSPPPSGAGLWVLRRT